MNLKNELFKQIHILSNLASENLQDNFDTLAPEDQSTTALTSTGNYRSATSSMEDKSKTLEEIASKEYFFKGMKEQGGVDFLPHLLDLRERYFPDLDLNFSADGRGRTPWWYLANSNHVCVMVTVLQTLKNHSIDLIQLLTHTERQTKLVEEAADKNRVLFTIINKVAGWHHSSGDQDMADEDEILSLSRTTSCSSISWLDEPGNQVSIQQKPCTSYNPPISAECHHSSGADQDMADEGDPSSYSERESRDYHMSSTHNKLMQRCLAVRESSDSQKNSTILHSHMFCTWDAEIPQHCGNLSSLNTFIQSKPSQESVDTQSPEAERESSTLLSTEFSEDSSCETSSRSDTTPPEADDELSSSGSCSTVVKHKRTVARKRSVKEKKSSSLTLGKCLVYLICALRALWILHVLCHHSDGGNLL